MSTPQLEKCFERQLWDRFKVSGSCHTEELSRRALLFCNYSDRRMTKAKRNIGSWTRVRMKIDVYLHQWK